MTLSRHQLNLLTFNKCVDIVFAIETCNQFVGRNPFSWAKPRLFGDFGQTSLIDNSIGCYLALVLATLFGDKKWPIRTLSPPLFRA